MYSYTSGRECKGRASVKINSNPLLGRWLLRLRLFDPGYNLQAQEFRRSVRRRAVGRPRHTRANYQNQRRILRGSRSPLYARRNCLVFRLRLVRYDSPAPRKARDEARHSRSARHLAHRCDGPLVGFSQARSLKSPTSAENDDEHRNKSSSPERSQMARVRHPFFLRGPNNCRYGAHRQKFGPAVGGLFLAFPAIFPATATLIASHEKEKKRRAGLDGTRRGRDAAALESRGTALSTIGLFAFAVIVWQLLPMHRAWLILTAAAGSWFVISVLVWRLRIFLHRA